MHREGFDILKATDPDVRHVIGCDGCLDESHAHQVWVNHLENRGPLFKCSSRLCIV